MKKILALASMMIVAAVSAQQPRIEKQEVRRIEIKQAKKEKDRRVAHDKNNNKLKELKNKKKEGRKREQTKIAFQKKQFQHKKEIMKRHKQMAYHPIKSR